MQIKKLDDLLRCKFENKKKLEEFLQTTIDKEIVFDDLSFTFKYKDSSILIDYEMYKLDYIRITGYSINNE